MDGVGDGGRTDQGPEIAPLKVITRFTYQEWEYILHRPIYRVTGLALCHPFPLAPRNS